MGVPQPNPLLDHQLLDDQWMEGYCPRRRSLFSPGGSPLMDRKWWTLVAVCTGVFMLLLDVTIVNVAVPDIQSALGAGLPDLQWVVDAYALSLSALLLTAGSVADRLGRRKVF